MRTALAYACIIGVTVLGIVTKNDIMWALGALCGSLAMIVDRLTDEIIRASNTIADAMPQGPDEEL